MVPKVRYSNCANKNLRTKLEGVGPTAGVGIGVGLRLREGVVVGPSVGLDGVGFSVVGLVVGSRVGSKVGLVEVGFSVVGLDVVGGGL